MQMNVHAYNLTHLPKPEAAYTCPYVLMCYTHHTTVNKVASHAPTLVLQFTAARLSHSVGDDGGSAAGCGAP